MQTQNSLIHPFKSCEAYCNAPPFLLRTGWLYHSFFLQRGQFKSQEFGECRKRTSRPSLANAHSQKSKQCQLSSPGQQIVHLRSRPSIVAKGNYSKWTLEKALPYAIICKRVESHTSMTVTLTEWQCAVQTGEGGLNFKSKVPAPAMPYDSSVLQGCWPPSMKSSLLEKALWNFGSQIWDQEGWQECVQSQSTFAHAWGSFGMWVWWWNCKAHIKFVNNACVFLYIIIGVLWGLWQDPKARRPGENPANIGYFTVQFIIYITGHSCSTALCNVL